MPEFEHRFVVTATPQEVARFHSHPEAFRRLVPPGLGLQVHRQEPLAEGSINEFTMWMGPLPVYWKAEHHDVSTLGFTDRQAAGPMLSWQHRHTWEQVSEQQTAVVDQISYQHHAGWRGLRSRLLFARFGLSILFAWRARATRRGIQQLRQTPHDDPTSS